LLGFVQCDPRCDDCETYNQTTGTCDPIECGVCSTCVSGTCQPVDDGTECGSGLVCQQGRCVAACPQECTVYQNGQCVAAPNGMSCGGGSSTCCNGTCSGIPGQACCSDAGSSCGPSLCCDPDTYCNQTCNNQYVCCVGDVLPDGTCCQADETPLRCGYADGSTKDVCCGAAANGYNECHCCGDECCTTNNCGPSGPVEC
jgi:hypothetical protein